MIKGYIRMCFEDWPDFDAIQQIEINVAAGIVRWIARREDSDFLIAMLRSADLHPRPDAWPAIQWLLWNSMQATRWIKVLDCSGPNGHLWREAVRRAFYKLTDDTFEYPTERHAR